MPSYTGTWTYSTQHCRCLRFGCWSPQQDPSIGLGSQALYRVLRDLPLQKDSQEFIQWITDALDGSEEMPRTYIQILHPTPRLRCLIPGCMKYLPPNHSTLWLLRYTEMPQHFLLERAGLSHPLLAQGPTVIPDSVRNRWSFHRGIWGLFLLSGEILTYLSHMSILATRHCFPSHVDWPLGDK